MSKSDRISKTSARPARKAPSAPGAPRAGTAASPGRPGTLARLSTTLPKANRPLNKSRNPLRLDRRREDREPVQDGHRPELSATYTDGRSRFGITHLQVIDQSPSGLGVRSSTLIEPGMTVVICPPGSRIPWLSARAVRCTPEADGRTFRVGLALVSGRRAA